jgi:phage N-6-adenine-methyltransferase
MSYKRKDGNVSAKDKARTPPRIFNPLNDRFRFGVDAFADNNNHLCPVYMSDDGTGLLGDALTQDWKPSLGVHYGNPPYSNPFPFVKKAYEEAQKGCKVVLLLPADISTAWFDYCMLASEWIRVKGRIKFDNPDGTPMERSPNFGSIVVVFDQETFDGFGPVVSELKVEKERKK